MYFILHNKIILCTKHKHTANIFKTKYICLRRKTTLWKLNLTKGWWMKWGILTIKPAHFYHFFSCFVYYIWFFLFVIMFLLSLTKSKRCTAIICDVCHILLWFSPSSAPHNPCSCQLHNSVSQLQAHLTVESWDKFSSTDSVQF